LRAVYDVESEGKQMEGITESERAAGPLRAACWLHVRVAGEVDGGAF
jgi:hypothetical protein